MRRLNAEDGQVIIVVALCMTVLLGMGALAVDLGALYVRKHQLQTGADAAAIAIAKQCAEAVVAGDPSLCNTTLASATSTDYFTANTAVSPDVATPDLVTAYAGRAGRVTVNASYDEPPIFSGVITDGGPVAVAATATARWGPMTAVDDVFPLAVCKGALPDVGEEVTLWSAPSGDEMIGECDGAPNALPMGWLTPSEPSRCTTDVTLLPSTYLNVAPSDTPPPTTECNTAINELLNDLDVQEWCHTTWWRGYHCHQYGVQPAEERTRVLAVYDAARPAGGAYPSYSLIAFEFTGARLGDREEHGDRNWSSSDSICRASDTTYALEELQCIRGRVTNYEPPQDGPIIDLNDTLSLGIIDDTTVLDVRLVD